MKFHYLDILLFYYSYADINSNHVDPENPKLHKRARKSETVLDYLREKNDSDNRSKAEETSLRREEMQLQQEKLNLEKEKFDLEKREREQRMRLEAEERGVIISIIKDKLL